MCRGLDSSPTPSLVRARSRKVESMDRYGRPIFAISLKFLIANPELELGSICIRMKGIQISNRK